MGRRHGRRDEVTSREWHIELVELPKGKKALTNKWIFKLKQDQHTFEPNTSLG